MIGAPSLELQPLGLGVRTDSGGHSLLSFGITVPRAEGPEVRRRLDEFFEKDWRTQAAALRVPKGNFACAISSGDTSDEENAEEDAAMEWLSESPPVPIPQTRMSPVIYLSGEIVVQPGQTVVAWAGSRAR